jgi:hypothetical protein
MTARDFSGSELDALCANCRDMPLDVGPRVLVISSRTAQAVLASSLLCRSIAKTGGVFHVTFVEPVVDASILVSYLSTNPNNTVMIVGVDVSGDLTAGAEMHLPVLIGSTLNTKSSPVLSVGSREDVSLAAYAIAREKLEVGSEELYLATAGSIIQNQQRNESNSLSKEMILLAHESDVLAERRGFRIFGANFLPAAEALSNSISPYLRGVTGNTESCERLLSEADIPPSRRSMPITSLAGEEKRRLTEKLTLKLDVSVISRLLGLDFENLLEPESSPLRFLSVTKSLSDVAWSRHETGLAMAVWMGDHGRILRMLLDSYRLHCRETISGVQRFLSAESNQEVSIQLGSIAVAHMLGVPSEVLPDVCRIAFENGYANREQPLVLEGENSACFAWAFEDLGLIDVLHSFAMAGLSFSSASPNSVLIQTTKENRDDFLKAATSIIGETTL